MAIEVLREELERCGGPDTAAGSRLVQAFWEGLGARSPLSEPDSPGKHVVTFLWRQDRAGTVLLFVNRLTDERDLAASKMRRLPGTDLWWLSYRMDADWRASYAFIPMADADWRRLVQRDQVALRDVLDRGLPDPRNPATSRNRAGTELSVVSLPNAPRQDWLEPRSPSRPNAVTQGRTVKRQGPDGRPLWVYQPPSTPTDSPLVLVLDGEVWATVQDLPTTVDNLVADGLIRPPHLLLLDSGGRERRWAELADSTAIGDYLAGELLEWARREYPVSPRAADTVVAGQSLGALVGLRTALAHPTRVGGVLSQSASLWLDDLAAPLAAADLSGLRVYLEVGAQEWVLNAPNRALAQNLERAGAEVRFVEYNGGHDYACWRGGIADGLRELLA
jgi:enterochelin esterase family protein